MRAIGSGVIRFGLVYIPVRIYGAVASDPFDLVLLRRHDRCRIRYVRVCEDTGEEVPWEDIVKGYEYEDGRYVVLDEEDLELANVRKAKTIDILSFVDVREIDPKYLEKPYYLEPDADARSSYALLRAALKASDRVGIARFVMRAREHMALLRAEEEVIVLNQIRFASEIRSPEALKLPPRAGVDERELDMALQLIRHLTEPWEPEKYADSYAEDLMSLVRRKIEGLEIQVQKEEPPFPTEPAEILSQLRRSLKTAREG